VTTSFRQCSEEAWDKIFDVNVKSSFLLAKEAFPHLEKTRGSIVFISSVGGLQPLPVSRVFAWATVTF